MKEHSSSLRRLGELSRVALRVLPALRRSRQAEDRRRFAKLLKSELAGLGPTFVKLGQAISVRPDIFGEDFTTELATLQDRCDVFSAEEALSVLEEELGVEVLHSSFSSKFWEQPPVASASLGQVYKAKAFLNGDALDVAVKVQRPQAKEQIELDVSVLEKTIGSLKYFKDIVALVGRTLIDEVDYLKEASNAEEFALIQKEVPNVLVPRPIRSLSTKKVLVLEWIEGQTVKEISKEKDKLLALTSISIECTITQLLLSNVLHGDPHGGNLLYTVDGKLAYLDFGVLCRVKPEHARALLLASVHIIKKQYKDFIVDLAAMDVLDRHKVAVGDVVASFEKEFAQQRGKDVSDQMKLNNVMVKLGYKYKFNTPSWYTTLIRALAPLEGYGLSADPTFNILDACYPLIMKQICFDSSEQGRNVLKEFLLDAEDSINADLLQGMSNKRIVRVIEEFIPIICSSKARALRSTLYMATFPKSMIEEKTFLDVCFIFAFFIAYAVKDIVLPGVWAFHSNNRVKKNRLRRLVMSCWTMMAKYIDGSAMSTPRRNLSHSTFLSLRNVFFIALSVFLSLSALAYLSLMELRQLVTIGLKRRQLYKRYTF